MRFLNGVAGVLMCAAAIGLSPQGAAAQDYPSRLLTMIVPFPAGGPTDTIARVMAEAMSKTLGQQIVIENVAGAGGTLGAARAARAAPDGHTLLIHHVGLATAATLYRKLPYDTKSAFAPIGLVTEAPMTIIGRPNLEPGSLSELVSYLKVRGDKATLANAGLGSASQLCGMMFMTAIERQLTVVPYKGGGPIMNDLLGKQVDLVCDQATSSASHIKSGHVKAYALTTKQRLRSLPDLPTADEAGLKGFTVSVWHGLYAPAGTPPAAVQKLSGALRAALTSPAVAARFNDLSTDPVAEEQATPAALQRTLLSEIDRWAPLITAAGQFAD